MEAADLGSPAYWESEGLDIRLNPRRPVAAAGIEDFLRGERGLCAAVVLPTSGSAGPPKFVVLAKRALLASAEAVNRHCGAGAGDVWLASLPAFHVGGLGVYARAFLSGARVAPGPGPRWDRSGAAFLAAVREGGATLASLVPAQLHDLVRAGAAAPPSLRAVFVGGGRLDPDLAERARELGWPVRATYGLSEASSQVAAAAAGELEPLPVLSCWECRVLSRAPEGGHGGGDGAPVGAGRLQLRGAPLFSGYARREGGTWSFEAGPDPEGWWTAPDRVELDGAGGLRFLGREDDRVKISGELVSVSELGELASRLALEEGGDAWVVAVEEPRRGHALVLATEGGADLAQRVLERFNAALPALERAGRVLALERLPRSGAGKIDAAALRSLAGRRD